MRYSKNKQYALDDLIPFGKYRGVGTFREVMTHLREHGADYLRWCLQNVEWFELDAKVLALLAECPSARADHLWSWLGTEDAPNLSALDLC
jgi:hypothetical protein